MATLSLNLPPEVAKIMPWIIAAKASGMPKQIKWAKGEYEFAQTRAKERTYWEQELEVRRQEWAREREERELQDAFWREYDKTLQELWEREDRANAELYRLGKYWARLGFPRGLEDGFAEIQPTQSSQKGWRRLLSEHADWREKDRYSMWGGKRDYLRSNQTCSRRNNYRGNKHNCGRKPRKPWFKKTRR